jgi:hypothetical protein
VAGYGLEIRGLIAGRGNRVFSSLQRLDRLWGETNLLYNGYWEFFLRGKSGRGVKLTTNFNTAPRSGVAELYLHFSIRLHGVVLN